MRICNGNEHFNYYNVGLCVYVVTCEQKLKLSHFILQISNEFLADMGHLILGVLLCVNLQYLLLEL